MATPPTKGFIILVAFGSTILILAAIIGLTLHYTLPPVEPQAREDTVVDCIPEGGDAVTEDLCNQRECVWSEPSDGAPWCTFQDVSGYLLDGDPEESEWGYRFNLRRIDTPTLFGNDLEVIVLDIEFQTEHRIKLKFYNPGEVRYEVPQEAVNITRPATPPGELNRLYDVQWTLEPRFGLHIIRRDTQTSVFDTTLPGFTFSDQYLQLTTRLPSSNMYGLGEHNHKRWKHDMEWRKWSIFTRDVAPVDDWNLYGAQPMYMIMEDDGNANAVLLLNSNAMDIVIQPDPFPAVSFRTIGGILDFYIFLGPTPENVAQQYVMATGMPIMVPYWSLGFQLSRWGYENLSHVEEVVTRNREAGIPQDIQYGDIDYMESKLGFTYDKVKFAGLPEFVDELHNNGMRYIIILDNFIGANETIFEIKLNGSYPPYTEGMEDGIFVMDPRNEEEPLLGEVWPGVSVYPDFTLGEPAKDWWKRQCVDFYENWRVEYDALWIDMNEPSSFQPGSITGCLINKYNYPPYVPYILGSEYNGSMYDKTICMDAPQNWGLHYNVHSLYGHSHSIVTYQTLNEQFPTKRPWVLTRSNFIGTQKYAMHWLGDNQSQWPQLHWSIIGMLEYSLFGFAYIGADICGFWYEATEEMCQRWMQLGAFYPFARNHNADTWPDQDPAAFGPEMIASSRDVLLTRYKLLPYLYTLMHEAHVYGSTVVRPMMHEFVSDKNTWDIDTQFMWGAALLISPALNEGQHHVIAYFPNTRWYDYYGGLELESPGGTKNLSTPLDKINLHIRGSYILPYQEPAINTVESRKNPMGLLVALGSRPNFAASGSLFWDDGESHETYENEQYLKLQFECSQNTLQIIKVHDGYTDPNALVFDSIDIWGMDRRPASFALNGTDIPDDQIEYDFFTKAARLTTLGLNINDEHTITWEYEI